MFLFVSLSLCLGLWVDDEAVYVCEAHNVFGKIEAQARITVTGLGGCSVWQLSPDFSSSTISYERTLNVLMTD